MTDADTGNQRNEAAERSAHVARGPAPRPDPMCMVCGKPNPAHAARIILPLGIAQACSQVCAGDPRFADPGGQRDGKLRATLAMIVALIVVALEEDEAP